MPNGSHAEARHDPTAVPPGVLLGRKADVPMPKVDLSARTERIEIGHENVRKEGFADVMRQVDSYRSIIVLTADAKRRIAGVVAEFALAVMDLDAKIDPTVPAKASVDGYKRAMDVAGQRALARMSEIASDSWERFES